MASITIDDVQSKYGEKEPALSAPKKDNLVSTAERLTDDVFGGRVARTPEIEGNEDDFAAYLGAHLWTLAEGGEVGSESQTGGSVSFAHLTSNIETTLTETRFGRLCLLYLREGASTAIVRTDI